MSFGEGRHPRARKVHYCVWCHTDIGIGERYFYFFGEWDGELQDWRMHADCEDAHQRETEEGEICDIQHQRGRTCAEKDAEQRKFAQELGEEIRERLAKCNNQTELFFTNLADDLLDLTEQWNEEELARVEKASEDAKKPSAPVETT